MPVQFDSRSWPLVTARIVGRDDDDSVQGMLDGLLHHLSRSRCAVIIDTTELIYPALHDAQRWTRQEGQWLRQHRDLVAKNCCGVGFVITNPAVRFILSGIFLIAPLPCEHIVAPTQLEARAFCESRLRTGQIGVEAGRPSAMRPTALSQAPKRGSKTAS